MRRHERCLGSAPVIQQGIFVVSLDLELYWGVRDKFSLDYYKDNLLGARIIIPRLLRLFEKYDIHATWATVGFLFFDCREDLLRACPNLRPIYANQALCPYRDLSSIGNDEQEDPFHFAPSLIREIASFPDQEIASHTFSHYYCLEPGQTKETFRADLDAALAAAAMWQIKLKSIIFPKNQCNSDYFDVCREREIIAYRGAETFWFAQPDVAPHKRAVRLLDWYLPISGHNCYEPGRLATAPLVNIPSSRFLRFHALTRFDRRLLLNRILSDLSFAARHGLIYHLWWHPHNLGRWREESVVFLTAIFDHVTKLRKQYGMVSLNMSEFGAALAGRATASAGR
ncbi:MAG: polysaccharide deacetylase family protein [Bryobacteraceae bacterium]